MIVILAAALLGQTPAATPGWTWTLYADSDPVVLSNEIPDTPNLRATFECERGSSVARLTLYGAEMAGTARMSAGEAVAVGEAETSARGGDTKLSVRTDHPAFAAFAAEGVMAVTVGDARRPVEVPGAHLAKLRRFTELCSG
ncbi:MAG TPA: hypothetical protein VGB60_01305 [Brevundimonas sp.]|uniref:hypothetical protein n=1 Tax=Brevundimonas sp. TaxID=1871086 RepID=UPI002EDA3728